MKKMKSPLLASLLLTLSSLVFAVPSAINYQGRLLDNNGVPVTQNGMAFTVGIWSDETATTIGFKEYEETHSVNVNDGVYSFKIGNGSATHGSWGSDIFTNNDSLWIEITVSSETLTPRQQILSAPFTLQAENSDTLDNNPASYFGTAAQVSTLQGQTSSLQSSVISLQNQINSINGLMEEICTSGGGKWSQNNGFCVGGSTQQCTEQDFSYEDFGYLMLNGANCKSAVFDGTNLKGAVIWNSDFYNAYMDTAIFTDSKWYNTICPDGTNSDQIGNTCNPNW